MYQFGFLKRGEGGFGGGGTTPPTTVPKVLSSQIDMATPDGILITWDMPMHISAKLSDAITVHIGATVATVKGVELEPTDPKNMVIIMDKPFTKTDVVTWSYDDQHPTELMASIAGTEADNQTYGAKIVNIPAAVFIVKGSAIKPTNESAVVVEWEEAPVVTGDLTNVIRVSSPAGTDVKPIAVNVHGVDMFIEMKDKFTEPDVVTWHLTKSSVDNIKNAAGLNPIFGEYNVSNGISHQTPPPPPADDILDLDGDGKPDEVRGEFGKVLITEDSDSVNVDVDGDGVADIVIAKPKPKRKPRKKPVKRKKK